MQRPCAPWRGRTAASISPRATCRDSPRGSGGFWRASSAAKHDAGLRATAKLALPAHRLYDELAADGVRFETKRLGIVHAFLDASRAERIRRTFLPLTELGYHLPDSIVDGQALREAEPALSEAVVAGFVVPNERVVYPPSVLDGLRTRLVELGGTVREHEPVTGFVTKGDTITGVRSGGDVIDGDEVVLAAGVWTRQLAARLGVDVPVEPGKGYSFSVSPVTLPSHCLHLYEAKVAVSPFSTRVRVAGTMELSGLKPELNRRRVAAVARASEQYVTGWEAGSLREEWMGMRPMTADGLPVLGRPRAWRNLCLATGHGMVGMMLAPATGHAIARLILEGAELPELRPFSPDRFVRRSKVPPRGPNPQATEVEMSTRSKSAEQL